MDEKNYRQRNALTHFFMPFLINNLGGYRFTFVRLSVCLSACLYVRPLTLSLSETFNVKVQNSNTEGIFFWSSTFR